MPVVSAVALKLPLFWSANPDAWLCHTKDQFALRNITISDTKYYHVVATLYAESSICVAPLIDIIPEADCDVILRALLAETYGLSEDECARAFFDLSDLGDWKSSEVMDYLLRLHKGEIPSFLLPVRPLPVNIVGLRDHSCAPLLILKIHCMDMHL